MFYTNLGVAREITDKFKKKDKEEYLSAEKLIQIYHLRGKDELSHRGIKDFGTEQLPFQRFEPNSVFYNTMLISYFLFETFKRDVLKDAVESIEVSVDENSYPTTFRRYLIDFAAKIVHSGREIILKVTGALWERIKIPKLWERCNNPPVISLA